MQEIWKDIDVRGYQVSNLGKVRKFHKSITQTLSKTGYFYITACDGPFQKKLKAHRLVAIVFIPNPENKKFVNHKDGNKLNNQVDNLEWCTSAENNRHALVLGLRKMPSGKDHCNSSKVIDTSTGAIFHSMKEASIRLSINENTIRAWLGGFRKNKSTLKYYNKQ